VRELVGPGLSDIKLSDFLLDAGSQDVLGNIEIVVHLKAQPETGRISEVPGEPERRIGSDTAPPVYDFVDSSRGNAQIIAKLILADAQRLEKLLIENLARMYWGYLAHDSPLMVVDNLNVIDVSISPDETDSPLVVYPYDVLSLPLAGQCLESIPGRDTKVLNR
jgi:hypothetical protein